VYRRELAILNSKDDFCRSQSRNWYLLNVQGFVGWMLNMKSRNLFVYFLAHPSYSCIAAEHCLLTFSRSSLHKHVEYWDQHFRSQKQYDIAYMYGHMVSIRNKTRKVCVTYQINVYMPKLFEWWHFRLPRLTFKVISVITKLETTFSISGLIIQHYLPQVRPRWVAFCGARRDDMTPTWNSR